MDAAKNEVHAKASGEQEISNESEVAGNSEDQDEEIFNGIYLVLTHIEKNPGASDCKKSYR